MSQVKYLEIRDRHTFIPAVAIQLNPYRSQPETFEFDKYLISRAGYPTEFTFGVQPGVILVNLQSGKSENNPYNWSSRTMQVAHREIQEYWQVYNSGDIIDVEYILKETDTPKISERFTT